MSSAHAVGFYDRPRMTGDNDLFVDLSQANAERLKLALDGFGTAIGEEGARLIFFSEKFNTANHNGRGFRLSSVK